MQSIISWIDRAVVADSAILVATDYDGTLTDIVGRPEQAVLSERARAALVALAHGSGTHVAILSGRTLSDLSPRIDELGPVWHSSDNGTVVVDPTRRAHIFEEHTCEPNHAVLSERAEALARVFDGAWVETKPRGVALHYRGVAEAKHDALVEMFRLSCSTHGARVLHGRKVIEGHFGACDKGSALRFIAESLPAETAVIYVGDDATDEPALEYAHKSARGLALHVSSSERMAPRVHVDGWLSGPDEWIEILEALATLRGRPAIQQAIAARSVSLATGFERIQRAPQSSARVR